jgi:hypothetical protein
MHRYKALLENVVLTVTLGEAPQDGMVSDACAAYLVAGYGMTSNGC